MEAIVIKTEKAITKMDRAIQVFNECYQNGVDKAPQRKDIIARLMKECDLTQNGAATYLQNLKKKAGIVNSKK